MQFLSGLSLIGLMAFIAFSTVGRADGWQERHNDYPRNTDPIEIINNEYDKDMYESEVNVEVDVDVDVTVNGRSERYKDRDGRRGDNRWRRGHDNRGNYYPAPAPPVLPYPGVGYGPRPICRVLKINNSYMYDLWLGNGIYRRGDLYFIQQVYWSLVNSGQCTRGNW